MDDSSDDEDAQLLLFRRLSEPMGERPSRVAPAIAEAKRALAGGAAASSAASTSKRDAFLSLQSDSEDDQQDDDDVFTDPAGSQADWCTRRAPEEAYKDRRGSYDRKQDGVGRRKQHAQYAFEHRQKVEGNMLGAPCTEHCPYNKRCWMDFTPRVLLKAHEHVYGSPATRSDDGKYFCAVSQAFTRVQHEALMQSWVTLSTSEPPRVQERFFVEQRGPVCAAYACAAYDMSRCWNVLHAAASRGCLASVYDHSDDSIIRKALMPRDEQAQWETIQWHITWLKIEDQMPNEPVIVYRNVTWAAVYEMEYVPDMQWFGTTGVAHSLSHWNALRKPALEELSVEWFGDVASTTADDVRLNHDQRRMLVEGGGFGIPIECLTLQRRAKHSNFGSCPLCDAAKQRWIEYRRKPNRVRGDAEEIKQDIFQHLADVKTERKRAEAWHQMCAQRSDWLFEYDDK